VVIWVLKLHNLLGDTNVSEEHAASIFRRECFTTLSASRVSNGRMISEYWIRKDLEGSGHSLIKYYPAICMEVVNKTMKCHDSWCPDCY
jgi:hypothetical protein